MTSILKLSNLVLLLFNETTSFHTHLLNDITNKVFQSHHLEIQSDTKFDAKVFSESQRKLSLWSLSSSRFSTIRDANFISIYESWTLPAGLFNQQSKHKVEKRFLFRGYKLSLNYFPPFKMYCGYGLRYSIFFIKKVNMVYWILLEVS